MNRRTVSFTLAVLLNSGLISWNAAYAQRPRGGDIPTIKPGIQQIPGLTPSGAPGGQSRGGSDIDWKALGEGILRGMQQREDPRLRGDLPSGPIPSNPGQIRPGWRTPVYPMPVNPQPYPVDPPSYQVIPQPYPGQFYPSQPSSPSRVVTPTLPSNVLIEPEPVIPSVPAQPSPWGDRVWEASVRETSCYAGELQQLCTKELASFRSVLGKTGGEGTPLFDQLDTVQVMLQKGQSWRQLEPVMQQILEQNRNTFSAKLSDQWRGLMRMVMVREAFLLARTAPPRGRGLPFDVGAIPTGIIFVVYDPLLPVGTGLFVSDRLMICGGGQGSEFRVTTCSAAEGLGLPVAPGDPVPDISEKEASQLSDSILIRNLADATATVHYLLNSRHQYSMEPGHSQKLGADKEWVIEFDRGNGQGAAKYKLSSGTYEFRVVSGRWDLVRVKFRVNLDNTAGKQDFSYLRNNEVVTVKAGENKEIESTDPIVLAFDRGEGAEKPARKNLNKSGTYKIAIDTDTNYLDLFETETS